MDKRRSEIDTLIQTCASIRENGSLAAHERTRLLATFGSRFRDAETLVEEKTIKKFIFRPSGRVVWVVEGRTGKYQVIPDSNFCSCDDYYFRVMGKKKELCYHIIGQWLAHATGKFETQTVGDEAYSKIVSQTRNPAT